MKDSRNSVPSIVQPTKQAVEDVKKKNRNKKVCFIVTAVLVTVGVVTGIITAGFYLGVETATDSVTESVVIFFDQNGGEIKQQVTVTGEEEIYTVPGQVSVVFNFKTGLMVMRDLEFMHHPCMMTYFNDSELQTPEKMAEKLKANREQREIVNGTVKNNFYGYGYSVKKYLLSEKMSELCHGVNTVWMLRDEPKVENGINSLDEEDRQRRQVTIQPPTFGDCVFICAGEMIVLEKVLAVTRRDCVSNALGLAVDDGEQEQAVVYFEQVCQETSYFQAYRYIYCEAPAP